MNKTRQGKARKRETTAPTTIDHLSLSYYANLRLRFPFVLLARSRARPRLCKTSQERESGFVLAWIMPENMNEKVWLELDGKTLTIFLPFGQLKSFKTLFGQLERSNQSDGKLWNLDCSLPLPLFLFCLFSQCWAFKSRAVAFHCRTRPVDISPDSLLAQWQHWSAKLKHWSPQSRRKANRSREECCCGHQETRRQAGLDTWVAKTMAA